MKKTYLLLFSFLTLATIAIISCEQFSAENEEALKMEESIKIRTSNVSYTIIDEAHNFNLSITFNNDGTHTLSASDKTAIGTYLKSRFSSFNFSSVSRIDALFSYDPSDLHNERVTVLGFGLDNNNKENPIAFEFNGNGDGSGSTLSLAGNSTGTEHSCAGAPCHCCSHIYKEFDGGLLGGTYKKIVGCKCDTSPAACMITDGKCNHTIKTIIN